MRIRSRLLVVTAAAVLSLLAVACGSAGSNGAASSSAAPSVASSESASSSSASGSSSSSAASSSASEPAASQPSVPMAPAPGNPGTAHVVGLVQLTPDCPITSPPQPCPARPYATQVEARSGRSDGPIAASGRSGADGRFAFDVLPGALDLVAVPDDPSVVCSGVPVTAVAGETVSGNISCVAAVQH